MKPVESQIALAQLFFSGKLSASQAFGGSKKTGARGLPKQCTKFRTNHSYVCSKFDAVIMGMMKVRFHLRHLI